MGHRHGWSMPRGSDTRGYGTAWDTGMDGPCHGVLTRGISTGSHDGASDWASGLMLSSADACSQHPSSRHPSNRYPQSIQATNQHTWRAFTPLPCTDTPHKPVGIAAPLLRARRCRPRMRCVVHVTSAQLVPTSGLVLQPVTSGPTVVVPPPSPELEPRWLARLLPPGQPRPLPPGQQRRQQPRPGQQGEDVPSPGARQRGSAP
jgi:hypothetical protein